jgi:integrase/recombinase XerD
MKQMNVTASVVPDKRRLKENDTLPMKLRITFKGERKYYSTGYDLTEDDWKDIKKGSTRRDLRETAKSLAEIQVNAQKCCDSLDSFSFTKFESAYFPKSIITKDLQSIFDAQIKELNANGQIGTATAYSCACVSLHKFKPVLKLEHITPDFLRDYEKWFIGQGKSVTTVSMYVRTLRTILNIAIQQGMMSVEDYPFGKRKYIIPVGRNIKKALTLEEIEKIYNYSAESGSNAERCRDYWIFIYLCNGLNVKDLCLLKYANINGDFITFHRAKTARTRRGSSEPIRISLKEEAKQIITKWGQQPLMADTYVFPCLKEGMTPVQERDQIQLLTHLINDHMKAIAKSLGFNKPVTTYYARHSFATILKNSGVSTEFISEALGHSSLTTTKNYLAGFEQEAIKKATDILVSFNKQKLAVA